MKKEIAEFVYACLCGGPPTYLYEWVDDVHD